MADTANSSTIGVLLSGGLDSAILVGRLLADGRRVQPFYVRTDVVWQPAEFAAVQRFLSALAQPRLAELVTFDLPLADVYADHWSITGRETPDDRSPDEAVFLPGRNALLVIKAAIWCQLRGVAELALAALGTSPFGDATPEFFADLESALNRGPHRIRIVRPFAAFNKREVMSLSRDMPLHLTFSCIAPVGELHCGRCNKCAERRAAFQSVALSDPTHYASEP